MSLGLEALLRKINPDGAQCHAGFGKKKAKSPSERQHSWSSWDRVPGSEGFPEKLHEDLQKPEGGFSEVTSMGT